jgi:hypothetical protein
VSNEQIAAGDEDRDKWHGANGLESAKTIWRPTAYLKLAIYKTSTVDLF